jgi:formate dehydrogenase major subunit
MRSCLEIKKAGIFGMAYRGFGSKVVADCDRPIDKDICRDCDVCISLCPTGALTKNGELTFGKDGMPLVITT